MTDFKIGEIVSFDVEGSELTGRGVIMGKAMTGVLIDFWIVQISHRPNQYMKDLPDTAILVQSNFIQPYKYDDDFYGELQRASDEVATWPKWKQDAIKRDAQNRDKEMREIQPNRSYYTQ